MAPYLATATVGMFDLTISTVGGHAELRRGRPDAGRQREVLRKIPDDRRVLRVDLRAVPVRRGRRDRGRREVVGYALETQTKPVFDRMPDEATLAHELAHMWFGDSVTLTAWPDIWLHEGFATWSEWIWSEHRRPEAAAQVLREPLQRPAQQRGSGRRRPATPATRRTSSTGRSTTAAA